MTVEETIKKSPNALEYVKDKLKEKIIEGLKKVNAPTVDDAEFMAFVEVYEIKDDMIMSHIEKFPYQLFEIFDNAGIYISVVANSDLDGKFYWTVSNSNVLKLKTVNSRVEAEKGGVIEAFKVLEKSLVANLSEKS